MQLWVSYVYSVLAELISEDLRLTPQLVCAEPELISISEIDHVLAWAGYSAERRMEDGLLEIHGNCLEAV